jgi:hypothetical protein
VDELLDDAGAGHLFKVLARFAELYADAFDVTDAKALPNELVQVHAAHRHLPSRFARRQADVLNDFRLHERQRLARWRSLLMEVPVAFEALAGDRAHRVDRPQVGDTFGAKMNRFDGHVPILCRTRVAEAALEADELDLVVAGLLHPLRDAAGRADRRTVVLILCGPSPFSHGPSVD